MMYRLEDSCTGNISKAVYTRFNQKVNLSSDGYSAHGMMGKKRGVVYSPDLLAGWCNNFWKLCLNKIIEPTNVFSFEMAKKTWWTTEWFHWEIQGAQCLWVVKSPDYCNKNKRNSYEVLLKILQQVYHMFFHRFFLNKS